MARIFIIEDDEIMSECIARALENSLPGYNNHGKPKHKFTTFTNAIDAMNSLSDQLPDLIFLDILLSGPNGFSFLNELISYTDTMSIPVIIVTSLDLSTQDLRHYGVVEILQKETMTPAEIGAAARKALDYA